MNHRTLYRRKCNLCNKSIISIYSAEAPFPVYCPDCYWSDKWDSKNYGRDYDFSVPFFEQFKKLSQSVPHISLMGLHTTLINSEYNNLVSELRNCYLLFNSDYNENCSYGSEVEHSKECVDNTMIESCELCYQGVNLTNCYGTLFSVDCENCQNVWFSKSCMNCSDCVGCINLKNQKFHIFNQPYTKEEYDAKLKEFRLDSRRGIAEVAKRAQEEYLKFPNKYIHGRQNVNVSGDYINHCKNVRKTHIALESQECKYCLWLLVGPNKDCYDVSQFGDNLERVYDSLVCGKGVSDTVFSSFCVDNVTSLRYSEYCYNAQHMFGCSFMQRGNTYCILNKQYSKEEYETMVPRIIQHMNDMPYISQRGNSKIEYRYGEFFPPELSPFSYNETEAQEFMPLTKDSVAEKGFAWKEPSERNYNITIKNEAVPDSTEEIHDSILEAVLECAHRGTCNEQCATAFKITAPELQFYKRMNLPLPDLCSNCRSYQRMSKRNPNKLWQRHCMCQGTGDKYQETEGEGYKNTAKHFHGDSPCSNEFETSYSPERPEIVYCEACYQAEVA
ncbi:MAG: hypothetical protein NUV53_01765 [Patescibacteria group bacterium]|nr:hypothetical protein [Patescibacteria group bacterium]